MVRRNGTIWHYDSRRKRLTHIASQSDGMDPMATEPSQVGLFLDGFAPRSIDDLIGHEARCRTVTRRGIKRVAARKAYVLRLSSNRCNSHAASSSATAGPAMAWVDTGTLVLLRFDLYLPGGRTLLYSVKASRVKYGATIDPSLLLPPSSLQARKS
ncbi:MAG: hypothetical protein ACR2JC_08380 [Chloroflexota bacterium]